MLPRGEAFSRGLQTHEANFNKLLDDFPKQIATTAREQGIIRL
jgi:hypothetical protein